MIEKIEWNGEVFALIMRKEYSQEGVNFITAGDSPLQLGTLKLQRGAKIQPHIHRELARIINEVHEVLHIEYGEVEANFYDADGGKFGSVILNTGDTALLLSGGHGFNILEDSKILEVKQGPYYGVDGDKKRF